MKLEITIDPTGAYGPKTQSGILEQCGFIPAFAGNADYMTESLFESLDKSYNFGMHESHGGNVTDDGVFHYPEDPDLIPWIRIDREYDGKKEHMYQYAYGMVAIKSHGSDTYFITRMD